jgi:molybdopterin-guanine dinucleotide biosynthesis protein A
VTRGPGPVGVVLAGGSGRRIGGDKAVVELLGRPLLDYPLDALRDVVGADAYVVAKRDTKLPPLGGRAARWVEPEEPQHPLAGLVHALGLSRGRPVLAVAADMPLVTADLLRWLAGVPLKGAPAVVPRAGGRLQPLCAVYTAAAVPLLRGAMQAGDGATDAVEQLGAQLYDVEDDRLFFNVNTPDDLLQASAMLTALERPVA